MSSNIQKNYDKKIRNEILQLVNDVDSEEGIQSFLELGYRDRFNTLLEWSQAFNQTLAIIYSFIRIKINEIEHQRGEAIKMFNDTWMAFIIVSTLNLEDEDSFSDYGDKQVLSGRFEYFIDDESGWYVLYYISNSEQLFCGIYESEELINHLCEVCYSIQFNIQEWNNSDYMLSIIQDITGNFFDTSSHSSGATNKSYYYDVLGIDINATQEEIKAAYRKKCKEYHPDVYKEDDANEIMSKINEAYNNLKK